MTHAGPKRTLTSLVCGGRAAGADAKGRLFTKLSKEIMIAARAGADPASNPRLRMAVDAAKKASMTKDTLERAIKKGAGLLDDGAQYETVTYEGYAPHQVPVIAKLQTGLDRLGAELAPLQDARRVPLPLHERTDEHAGN